MTLVPAMANLTQIRPLRGAEFLGRSPTGVQFCTPGAYATTRTPEGTPVVVSEGKAYPVYGPSVVGAVPEDRLLRALLCERAGQLVMAAPDTPSGYGSFWCEDVESAQSEETAGLACYVAPFAGLASFTARCRFAWQRSDLSWGLYQTFPTLTDLGPPTGIAVHRWIPGVNTLWLEFTPEGIYSMAYARDPRTYDRIVGVSSRRVHSSVSTVAIRIPTENTASYWSVPPAGYTTGDLVPWSVGSSLFWYSFPPPDPPGDWSLADSLQPEWELLVGAAEGASARICTRAETWQGVYDVPSTESPYTAQLTGPSSMLDSRGVGFAGLSIRPGCALLLPGASEVPTGLTAAPGVVGSFPGHATPGDVVDAGTLWSGGGFPYASITVPGGTGHFCQYGAQGALVAPDREFCLVSVSMTWGEGSNQRAWATVPILFV